VIITIISTHLNGNWLMKLYDALDVIANNSRHTLATLIPSALFPPNIFVIWGTFTAI
jgi:hypothetical protein